MAFLKNIIKGAGNRSFFSGKTKKIVILSVTLIIIISYGLFFYLQTATENDIKISLIEQQRQRQIESSKAISQNIGSDLDSIMARLQMLAISEDLQRGQLSDNNTRILLEEVYRQIIVITPVDRLFILDKDNIVRMNIVPKGEDTFVGSNVSSLSWIKEATGDRKTSMSFFSNGYVGLDNKYRIVLTYPIINRQTGEYFGLVGVAIPTETFFAHYGNIHDVNSQFLAVFDRNATYLAVGIKDLVGKNFFGEFTQKFINHNPVLNNLSRNLFAGNDGYGVYDYGRGERLTTQFPVFINGVTKYFVQVVTPTQQIYSQINDVLFTQRIETFTLLAGTTAAIIVLIIFLIKWSNTLQSEVKRRTIELESSLTQLERKEKELNESNNQLESANEQLKLHDKMQKEFINIASHEMKTPTQAILGTSGLLQYYPEKKDELIEVIRRNAKRLQTLTSDILDVTRIESQTLKLEIERFNILKFLSEVIEEYTERIKSDNKNVKLIYDQKDTNHHILVEADKGRITQVLSNILNNALKFTNEGQIVVDAHENNDKKELIVSITDTGSGINRDIFTKLFSKFATKSSQGTGLGLYISKSIIEAHGGRIWAENNKDKMGATFIFTLPIVSGD
ncbi:hybrid sensor histidine kinase/response regulator [soil metagenome]